jgi:thiamine pyrophosphate-dependent acetolactate synthase large subunit-like protein
VTTQGWKTFEPLTFFESNGLSSMSYGFAGAMAAKLVSPEVPVLCTMGDGGFAMILSEIETCLRRRIHFPTVVFNDAALSLIRVSQESKGFPEYGVTYSPVDFAAVGRALGAWARRVVLMDEIDDAVREALAVDLPAVIDVLVDPTEYRAHYGLETSGD